MLCSRGLGYYSTMVETISSAGNFSDLSTGGGNSRHTVVIITVIA